MQYLFVRTIFYVSSSKAKEKGEGGERGDRETFPIERKTNNYT